MFKDIISVFNELDKETKKIMYYGIWFSIAFCVVAAIILITYIHFLAIPDLFYIGLQMIKNGVVLISGFIVCGIAVDKIKKELI